MKGKLDAIVCGAGLSGLITAWGLSRVGLTVAVVDDRAPPGADPFAEAGLFSTWWPVPDLGLYLFASRGIDLIEAAWADSGEGFGVSCRGEVVVATRPDQLDLLRVGASRTASFGAGLVREHETADLFLPGHPSGFRGAPGGFDWFATPRALAAAFPMVGTQVEGGLHVRRAGRVAGSDLRRWLTRCLRAAGVELVDATAVAFEPGADHSWTVRVDAGKALQGSAVVVASGSRLRGWLPPRMAGSPLVDHVRLTTRLESRSGPPGRVPDLVFWSETPSLETVRLSQAGLSGWQLTWMVEATAVGNRADDSQAMMERLRALVPDLALELSPSFASSATRVSMAADRRPLVGAVEPGLYLSVGHGDSLAFAFAAAELIATDLCHRALPRYAAAVAASRLSSLFAGPRLASDSPRL